MSVRLVDILPEHITPGFDFNSKEYEQTRCDAMNNDSGNLNIADGFDCLKCKNKGIIYFPKEYGNSGIFEMTQRECQCMETRRTILRLKGSGLGNVITDFTLDNFVTENEWQKTMKAKAEAFCRDDSAKWFYIGGQTGAGKTHICTAIAVHYIKAGYQCKYALWRDISKDLKTVINEPEYRKLMNELREARMLYIDDFLKVSSKATPTDADINIAFELLNHRIQDTEKITIISSEFTIDEAMQFDEATIGRIYQMAGAYRISISKGRDKNYRLRS